jgi:hypothetical protein
VLLHTLYTKCGDELAIPEPATLLLGLDVVMLRKRKKHEMTSKILNY